MNVIMNHPVHIIYLRTKSVDGLCEHHSGSHADEEAVDVRVQLDHPVEDGDEHGRRQDERGEVGELLGDEVDVGAVRAVEVLPQEDRQLQTERVDHGEHVLEGQLDDDQDEDAVDVRHRLRGHGILVEIDDPEEHRGELDGSMFKRLYFTNFGNIIKIC